MTTEHYEVELRELAYADDSNGALTITGEDWQPVWVFCDDYTTTPLVFSSLGEARGYADQDGQVRIVRVTKEGERLVIEPREVAP